MTSILNSIKRLIGIGEDDISFDPDIIMHINSVFSTLTQLGVGPPEGFCIQDEDTKWTDYLPANLFLLGLVRGYMYLKVKLLFDPPQSSAAIESVNKLAAEHEWRIQVAADPIPVAAPTTEGEEVY